jgi:hypothetical protein
MLKAESSIKQKLEEIRTKEDTIKTLNIEIDKLNQ